MKTESATLMFGMVSIPVQITATISPSGEAKTRLRNLHAACSTPVEMKAWCPTCHTEAAEVVKGVKINSKQYAPVPPDQVEAAKTERDRVVTITKFIHPVAALVAYNKHYWLMPDDNPKLAEGYSLLLVGMDRTKKVGVGSMALWGKEHPVVVQPFDGGLIMSLLHVAEDEVPRPFDAPKLPANKSMVGLAVDLIEKQAGTLEMADLTSASREKRQELVESILNKVENPAPSMDLLSALRLSIGRKKVKA